MSSATNAAPYGWIVAPLQEVVTLRSERVSPKSLPDLPYIGMEHVEPHTNRIIQTLPAASVTSSSARFWANDVLYGRMRPYLNKVAQPKFAGLASAEFMVFASSEHLHSSYLRMRLTSADFVEFALGQISGDRPRVKFEQLGDFAFALPPIREQHRIVEKLEELLSDLDAGVAELRAAQAKLKLYRQSLLKAAVTGELTTEWRNTARATTPAEAGTAILANILVERRNRWCASELERFAQRDKKPALSWQGKYAEPVVAGAEELPAVPKGWVWTTIDALIVDGPQNGVYLPGHLYGSGYPILRIDDFQNDWLRPRDQLNLVDADASTRDSYSLAPGDVVINRVNSMTHLGKCVAVGSQLAGVLFESNMMRMQLTPQVISRFVEIYLQSSVGRARLIGGAKWAVNQASINQQDVKRTPIPLPPWAEQVEIVEIVESQLASITEQSADIGHALRQSEAQRKNILQAAFSGRLVPQDPSDESASVLLARIRASRADKASVPSRRPRKAREPA